MVEHIRKQKRNLLNRIFKLIYYCDEERKEYFQEHIINKFEEGKDYVTFDW